VTYCGDTGAGVFELEPRLFESRIVLLECAFFAVASRGRGRQFKHLHLSDIADRVGEFRNEDLVLHHASWRYEKSEVQSLIERHLTGMAPNVHLMMD